MTIQTWEAEFYPVEAVERSTNPIEATKHSLRKWEGLREENLKKHNVHIYINRVCEGDAEVIGIGIGADSCALCLYSRYVCELCPIFKFKGGPCDTYEDSEFHQWLRKGDPEPMISLLKSVLESLLRGD